MIGCQAGLAGLCCPMTRQQPISAARCAYLTTLTLSINAQSLLVIPRESRNNTRTSAVMQLLPTRDDTALPTSVRQQSDLNDLAHNSKRLNSNGIEAGRLQLHVRSNLNTAQFSPRRQHGKSLAAYQCGRCSILRATILIIRYMKRLHSISWIS